MVAKSTVGNLIEDSWNTLPITASLSAHTNYWLVYNNATIDLLNNMSYSPGSISQGVSVSQHLVRFQTSSHPCQSLWIRWIRNVQIIKEEYQKLNHEGEGSVQGPHKG